MVPLDLKTISPTASPTAPAAVVDWEVENLQDTLTRLYQEANPSVVYIIVSSSSSGSGFVYDEDGHVVTNNHVVAAGGRYEVVFANSGKEAEVDALQFGNVMRPQKYWSGVYGDPQDWDGLAAALRRGGDTFLTTYEPNRIYLAEAGAVRDEILHAGPPMATLIFLSIDLMNLARPST